MEGKLIKWTNYFSGWKERIFILKGPLLYYYYNQKELPRGKVHLGLAVEIIAELRTQVNEGLETTTLTSPP
jgi:hypothetical protein